MRYERALNAWIMKSGADLMAVRMMATLDPDYDARGELQKEVDDCIRLADAPVAEAAGRGEHRAFYACDAVFAMAAGGGAAAGDRRGQGRIRLSPHCGAPRCASLLPLQRSRSIIAPCGLVTSYSYHSWHCSLLDAPALAWPSSVREEVNGYPSMNSPLHFVADAKVPGWLR